MKICGEPGNYQKSEYAFTSQTFGTVQNLMKCICSCCEFIYTPSQPLCSLVVLMTLILFNVDVTEIDYSWHLCMRSLSYRIFYSIQLWSS